MHKLLMSIIFLALPAGVFAQTQSDTCRALYREIEDDLARSNYCSQDSDCDVLELGGHLIRFGCYHFVNQATDKEAIYKKMNVYYDQCEQMINDCDRSLQPVCVWNKCVSPAPKPAD